MACFNITGAIFIEFSFIQFKLLTKRVIKLAGYWSSSFLIVFMDRYGVEDYKHANEKQGQYPAILANEGFIIWGKKHCGTADNP